MTPQGPGFYNPRNRAISPRSAPNPRRRAAIRTSRLASERPGRPARIAAGFAFGIGLAALLGAGDAAAAPRSIRVLSEDARSVRVEYVVGRARWDTLAVGDARYERVRVEGTVMIEPPGRPALPTDLVQIGVPDGMTPTIRIETEEADDRPGLPPAPAVTQRFVSDDPQNGPVSEFRYVPEPAIYAGVRPYPEAAASLGTGTPLGELWSVPVRVSPVRWNPATRSYRVLRRLVVRVDFTPATERDLALRAPARPGSDAGAMRRIQDRLLVNHASAQRFPRRPRETGTISRALFAGRLLDGNPEFRLSVSRTGWTTVSYASLAAAGFPAGIGIAKVGVWERGYSDAGDSATAAAIPVARRDANSNGVFDAGDAVSFYGRKLLDRVGTGSIENRYADANVYWLTWTSADAAAPDSVSGVIADPSPVQPGWFYDVTRLEEEHYLLAAPDPFSGSPPENIPYMFWTSGNSDVNNDDFTTSLPVFDVQPGQTYRFRARYQGQTGSVHRLQMFVNGAAGVTDTLANGIIFVGQEVLVYDSGFNLSSDHLAGAGNNTYRHVGTRQVSGGNTYIIGSAAWLDVLEVTYPRKFVARSNYLAFNSGANPGICELTVTGFTNAAVSVYDVTIPNAPVRVTGVQVSPSGGGFQALFRTDATGGARSFVAFATGGDPALAQSDIAADTPSALRTPGAFPSGKTARAIIVTPAAFAAAANRLADYRRSQGYVVEVADVQDIYDEFNGGIKSAHAIRRYLRHAYLTWTPAPLFVVLAGDGAMDHKGRTGTASADWIPTYLKFEEISGPQGRELVANDSYYSLGLEHVTPSDGDLAPRLALGRIPASSPTEMDQAVTKIIQYETYQPTDQWRGRLLLVSDDQYSIGLFGTLVYCEQPAEDAFEAANQAIADAAAANAGTADLQSVQYKLSTYTDALGPLCPGGGGPGCRDLSCVTSGLRGASGGISTFQGLVANGALIMNIETHANRYLIAHEQLFCGPARCNFPGDTGDLANAGRPPFLMVWGCHANQFPDGPVVTGNPDSTDAIGEIWQMLPDRGSIATFGSSAFEVLETNAAYNGLVSKSFFATPPSVLDVGGTRRARWVLGEVLMQAAIENASAGFLQSVMTRTVLLLGDPMIQMDALPPRLFEVTLGGTIVPAGAPVTTDSPTDSLSIQVKARDEVAVTRLLMAEREVGAASPTLLDSTQFTVVFSDTSRQATLTGKIRPHVGNYDILALATDYNGRVQEFPLAVRTPIRYFANGVEIVNGVFVESSAMLRAEITSPIPLTADSLTLLVDGIVVGAQPTALDGTGRLWRLESLGGDRGPTTHTVQVAVGGRTAGLANATFQISSQFTLRGVAVVDPRVQGAGCDGSIFQYELSAPASKVDLQLYTVAGRRVASISLPGAAGYNVYCWDGRDSKGHETANGVYLYRIRATDTTGRTADHDGRMIRTR
ncbi:MAG TPA: C25 family cysteine peptidase [Candidatus Eisenbacteria bacterium]|nr:C25 family cysteine peptidase [Candidatus Eisenbacteria bacterium]